jgi:MFS family permease
VFLIVAFVDFIDAMETAFLGIFLSILAYEWKLTTPELIWLGTAFYIGMVTGHAFCALFADYYGRKNSLILGTFLTFLTFIVNSQV